MMKLVDASSYFDLTEVQDPTTLKTLFKGQVANYDDSKRDSSSAYRRVLSVRPGTVIPASRTVYLMGRVWIIGAVEPDGLGELHREKYVIQQAEGLFSVSRLSGFLAGTVASTAWGDPSWVKDAKQLEVSSETPQIFDISVAQTADIRVHDVLWDDDQAFLALSPRQVASGIQQVNSLKLEQIAPVAATLQTRSYDPAAGTYSVTATASVNSLLVRWQSLFEYGSQMSERYQEGDSALVLPAGTVVTTASRVTQAGVSYQILSVLDVSGAVALHVRKA